MYTWVVRRRVERVFEALSRGDHAAVAKQMADDVHHVFAGDHALGGERHSREAVGRWFERLYRLFPQLNFAVTSVTSSGAPWNLRVAVEWTARVHPAAGDSYVNHGAHVLRIKRGRVSYLHAYEDSQLVARACERMAAAGIPEASAPPITG